MALEIERKFLVATDRLGPLRDGEEISQGFIATVDLSAVRIRLAGDRAWLTIKGETVGARRSEFEYAIPVEDALQILDEFCDRSLIRKTRYRRQYHGHVWEIDVFHGENSGLVIAEVELRSENESPAIPDWAIAEVTGDPRYYNVNLAAHPFSQWGDSNAEG
jgi:adenylate cyclase